MVADDALPMRLKIRMPGVQRMKPGMISYRPVQAK